MTVPGLDKTARDYAMTLVDLIEIGGSLLVLAAFAAAQLNRLDSHSLVYLVLNLVGSAVLATIALMQSSWGFLLLEGTWAIVSAISLLLGLFRAHNPQEAPSGGRL
ncbi:CBU_0592 family membrane protein [Pseudonocardia spinosispora]|uniref:CBU_0592 family membrane protein n=1 Tax=Pseudonocardia spinosispora TaxID=103441 RepID=UPI001B7F869B|nr:hypothetical protein [Pseudonocardia spinosispora]